MKKSPMDGIFQVLDFGTMARVVQQAAAEDEFASFWNGMFGMFKN